MGDAASMMDQSSSRTAACSMTAADARRLRSMVSAHYDLLARTLRGLGVGEGDVDDAAQSVLLVAADKLSVIAEGSERAFLLQTALRVAMRARRTRARRREVGVEGLADQHDPSPGPDAVAEQRHVRSQLDRVLDGMPMELRSVFVLYEVEEMNGPEIADILGIPLGTLKSRLRRAREDFHDRVKRMKARGELAGGAS
jgi:RNA polymerase sigma-70 factor (ECF subfamily)